MINKIYKIVNNKFSSFFKFIFFLRYLLLIFFVAIILFITTPYFIDFKKKKNLLEINLYQNYELKLKKVDNISYKALPTPHLNLDNATLNVNQVDANLEVKNIKIYPKLFSLYNFENYQLRKIRLIDSNFEANFRNISLLIKKIYGFKNKINFENLNTFITDNKNKIIILKNINYSNYGFSKHELTGLVFNKTFVIKLNDLLNDIDFKLLNTGISANLKVFDDQGSRLSGVLQGKILQSKFKLDFKVEEDYLSINKLFFRDKKLSFDSKGTLTFKPFFEIDLINDIKNIDIEIIYNFEIDKLIKLKDLIKKINSKNIINFESKKFIGNIVDKIELNTDLKYGRLDIEKKIVIKNTDLNCLGFINLIEDYPILNFNCSIRSPDISELFKKIKIDYEDQYDYFNLDFEGNLNILNKKINFNKIKLNEDYVATKDDLKFFKTNFETIFLKNNLFNIVNLTKIREFINAIS